MCRLRAVPLMISILMLSSLLSACLPAAGLPALATVVPPSGTGGPTRPAAGGLAGQSPLAVPSPEGTPALVTQSPISAPADTTPAALPTRQPGTGNLQLRLTRLNGQPLRGAIVYAALIAKESGLASVDPQVEPHSLTDSAGEVLIANLAPGQYALVLQTPTGLELALDAGGKVVMATIQPDQDTQLGDKAIKYDYPDN